MVSDAAALVIERVRRRDAGRAEAQLQADIYQLLTMGVLNLSDDEVARLEVQTGDGTRRRLDIQIGACCIEVKKDLRIGNVLADGRIQLAGYVHHQARLLGDRYVGILTDGTMWHLHRLDEHGELTEVDVLDAGSADPDDIIVWLESVLATVPNITPTTAEIDARLGAQSPAHKLDHAALSALYSRHRTQPDVAVKADLWAKLLRTAFGAGFDSDPDLFVDHTLLVLTAEAIAHAVVGFDLLTDGLTARELTRGTRFQESQIYGVVEEDFFDWVLDVEGGPEFVMGLARRVSRFNWAGPIRHDVLKALYTSVISPRVRESLGEYYTPDWLAEQMVAHAYTDPLHQRLLEPSCGSGTFLIHAVTTHLHAAEAAGMSAGEAVSSVIAHVMGMDIHPVAVALARVSYLIAIGQERLQDPTRGPVSIPVYLGDSLQWEQRLDLLAGTDAITISTAGDDLIQGGGALFGDDLKFPLSVLGDAQNFDQLVSEMADAAVDPSQDTSRPDVVMRPILKRRAVSEDADQRLLVATFDTLRRLHRSGRNHIWGYYVRNLIRPIWSTRTGQRVEVLVGNPPWLRYGKMTAPMQKRYKALAKDRNLLTGRAGATGRDLSTLFVARAVELYLDDGGAFSFVMPHGILTRRPHAGFRTGDWSSPTVTIHAAFDTSWDLDRVTTGFPMSSCVVHGHYRLPNIGAKPMPLTVTAFEGTLPRNGDVPWADAASRVSRAQRVLADLTQGPSAAESPYRKRFRQGAILVPRYLLFVSEKTSGGPLGAGAGRVKVESARSPQEKPPWKAMRSLSGTVEQATIHDVYLGETVAPFRLLTPRRAVLPLLENHIMTTGDVADRPGLSRWWSEVEQAWAQGRKSSEQLPLLERFDYQGQLSAQLPPPKHRVLYSASGNTLAAARIDRPAGIVEHKLYWCQADSIDEARYLTAILNSATLLERVQPLQARGLFGARDFDKYVFKVAFPTYDPTDHSHLAIACLAGRAETLAATVDLTGALRFQEARRRISKALHSDGVASELELAVASVLPELPT